uniref:Uncharacterized protein n=1 Tax=Mola mola TaxID=94237 RepID=A0A3Q3XSK2_MOLML
KLQAFACTGSRKPASGDGGFKPAPEVDVTHSHRFLRVELELNANLRRLTFSEPVQYVYNPLEYAWDTHRCYVETYCRAGQRFLFLGMNPGPFGMAQTGVPFGEVKTVVDWLKITGSVGRPDREHPNRQITGLACTRSEVSGQLLPLLRGPVLMFTCPLLVLSAVDGGQHGHML